MRFETDGVVGSVNVTVGQRETVAIDDVDAVVVPKGCALHPHVVDPHVLTLVVHAHPVGGVAEGHVIDFHVFAFPEEQQPGTDAFGHTVVGELVVDEPGMDHGGAVVAQLAPLSVDAAPAAVNPDEADVLHPFGHDEGMVVGGHQPVVVPRVGAAHKDGAFHQLDGHIRLQVDASREVTSHPETQGAAALLRNPVDGLLDAARVHRHTVAADAELGGVIHGFRLLCQKMAQVGGQEKQE